MLVHGFAFSPTGKPVTSVDVRLKLATVDKTLRVKGDRRWERSIIGVNLGPPEPLEIMPIVYERLFGERTKGHLTPEIMIGSRETPLGKWAFLAAPARNTS